MSNYPLNHAARCAEGHIIPDMYQFAGTPSSCWAQAHEAAEWMNANQITLISEFSERYIQTWRRRMFFHIESLPTQEDWSE